MNDTVVEAELRTLRVPPLLPVQQAADAYWGSVNRLLILVRQAERRGKGGGPENGWSGGRDTTRP